MTTRCLATNSVTHSTIEGKRMMAIRTRLANGNWLRHRMLALAGIVLIGMPAIGICQERVRPSLVDPAVRDGDTPYLVYVGDAGARDAPLAVFLPGTNGTTAGAPQALLRLLADHGYRVIYLSYDDRIAATNVCPKAPPGCFAAFRQARLFGGGGPVPTPRAESIVTRLTELLHYLDREHPDAGWNGYLSADGPTWPRIVMSGLSQGAGMAAFLAKRYPLRRVVLFSSPWDFRLPDMQPAPWLYDASATPMDRWWAERHVRENTTKAIERAYQALRIPSNHVLLFDGPPPPAATGDNPYHVSTVRMEQYVPQWRVMYGVD